MGGHPFPEIPCTICAKPVDLETDLTADENGNAVLVVQIFTEETT